MRRALIGIAAGIFAVVTAAPAALAQEKDTKWVRGTVTAVTGDSITVKAKGKDYRFAIDRTTEVEAPGAGRKTRAAQKAGEGGVSVADVIKVGSGAEVRYHDQAGTLHAARIRGGLSPSEGSTSDDPAPKATSASGTVSAVTNDSLTVTSGANSWTFAVDKSTKVVGEGVGTLSRKMKEAGKGMTITDAVGVGDTVTVSFTEAGGAKTATNVNITRKGAKTE
jgi:Domain of unknown function (DUF5666)